MRNWAELLTEILYLISDRVNSLQDLAVFGGVCSTWRHVAVEQNLGLPLLPLPWLMLAENKNDDVRDYYSITEGKTHSFKLPELKGKLCMETKGWIVTASEEGREMALVQPLTGVQIPLPQQNTSSCYEKGGTAPFSFVDRAVLSSPPDPNNNYEGDWVLAILHGSVVRVGFCRPGDKVWTVVENFGSACDSLEYYRGKFYVTNSVGEVGEYDIVGKSNDTSPVSPIKIKANFGRFLGCKQSYLVKSEGSLLVVLRTGVYRGTYRTTKFFVREIDSEKRRTKKVMSLGTRTIFLGRSASLSVDTSWYPELSPNSIYFTDDEGKGKKMGIYNLEDKSVRTHYSGKSLSMVCPPIWTFLTTK